VGFVVGLVLVVIVGLIVGADASSLKRRGVVVGNGTSPVAWAGGVILLLIIFLPYYLYSRSKAVNAAPNYPAALQGTGLYPPMAYPTQPAAASPPMAARPSSLADELRKLDELRQSGVLTDDEFEAAKQRLLS
jgi:hypothetical protein